MTTKATKKQAKVGGIVMATRAPLALHKSMQTAAKEADESLGNAMIHAMEMYLAAPRKRKAAPVKAAKKIKPMPKAKPVSGVVAPVAVASAG